MSSSTHAQGTTTYSYNALGERVKKSGPGGTTIFAYDEEGHLIGEYTSAGVMIQEIVWFEGLPVASLRPAAGGGIEIFNISTDHLGTPRVIRRATDGVVVWRWDSDPFGTGNPNENPSGAGTFKFNLRFPGQYADAETGLNYNYFRDYNSKTGRYVQSDPIGLDGGLNMYSYGMQNPIAYVDTNGGSPTLITAAIGAGVGAIVGGGLDLYNHKDWRKGAVNGAIRGGVAGLALGVGGIAIAEIFGGGIIGGMASGAAASTAGDLATQAFAVSVGDQQCLNWTSIGLSAVAGAAFGGLQLRPSTAPNQLVTSWARPGANPADGTWAMVGGPSWRNWLMSGTSHYTLYQNSITKILPNASLIYPKGPFGQIKGSLGQRRIN